MGNLDNGLYCSKGNHRLGLNAYLKAEGRQYLKP